MKNLCQHSSCTDLPTRGCFCLPKAKADLRFAVQLLCEEHGKVAVAQGARRLSYRPGFLKTDAEEQQDVEVDEYENSQR